MKWIAQSLTLLLLPAVMSCPAPAPVAACVGDQQCPVGFRCDPQGRCVHAVDTHADSGAQDRLALDRDAAATDRARPDQSAGDAHAGDDRAPGDRVLPDRSALDARSPDARLADQGAADQLSSDRVAIDRVALDHGSSDSRAEDASCADSGCDAGPVLTDCRDGYACNYPLPQCNPETGLCVECLSDGNCDDGLFCTVDTCQADHSCDHSEQTCDNSPQGPQCDEDNARCVECLDETQCSLSGKTLCDTTSGTCVQCLDATDCSDNGNPCTDTACNSSGQCLYVNNNARCDDGDICNGSDRCANGTCSEHDNVSPCGSTLTPLCSVPLQQCVECLSDGNCDDGRFCTTPSVCGADGTCSSTTNPCFGQHPLCDEGHDLCKCQASPNSCTGSAVCRPNGRCRKTINRAIAARDDDGYQDPFNTNGNPNNAVLGIGEIYVWMSLDGVSHPGTLRFTGLNVPQGSTIVSAKIQVYCDRYDIASPDLTIRLQAVDDAPQLNGSIAYEVDNLAKTTSYVSWTATSIGVGWKDTPELKTVVQEIVDRPGWSSGNAMLFVIQSQPGHGFQFLQQEGGLPSKLILTYEY